MIIWRIGGNDDFGDDVNDEGYGAVPPLPLSPSPEVIE